MSEPIKKPIQTNPESYKPEAPKMMGMLEKTQNKVIFTENGAYVDSFPKLGEGDSEWGDCTHSYFVTLVLKYLGIETTYEQVMGLSGSCYRVSMIYGWDPGSNILDITSSHLGAGSDENACRFYGIDIYAIETGEAGEKATEEQVRKSVDAGIPVLILGGKFLPEWSVLLGYEKTSDGYKYFGRSFFDGWEANDVFLPKIIMRSLTDTRLIHNGTDCLTNLVHRCPKKTR